MQNNIKQMFTLKQGNKTVGLVHKNNHYIIGFESFIKARKVQYNLHPNPEIMLVRGDTIDKHLYFGDIDLKLDIDATLFLPKYKGSPNDPMNDGNYHLNSEIYNEFIVYPFFKNIGIILPTELKDEDENEFMFKAHVIEPSFNSKLFGI